MEHQNSPQIANNAAPAANDTPPASRNGEVSAVEPIIVVDGADRCRRRPAHRVDAAAQQLRFERYVVPELDFVRRITRRFSRNGADAEDLMQEVLTNAFRAIERFDGRYPRAWLYRIASNAAASRARRHRDTVSLPEGDRLDAEIRLAADERVEDLVVDPIVDAVLVDAMDELPEHYRSVIDLVDVGSLSYEDAAAELGVPTGTVMSRLHRGRRRLRAELAGTHLDRAAVASRDAVPV